MLYQLRYELPYREIFLLAPIWVLLAQLVEHWSSNAEPMVLNPVQTLKIVYGLKFPVHEIVIKTAIVVSQFHFYYCCCCCYYYYYDYYYCYCLFIYLFSLVSLYTGALCLVSQITSN